MTDSVDTNSEKALWHGRFLAGPDDALLALTNEQHTDLKIAEYDIAGFWRTFAAWSARAY